MYQAWKNLQVGNIIKIKIMDDGIDCYYKLCESDFEIGGILLYGKHFKLISATNEIASRLLADIRGYELIQYNNYEIVDEVPENLKS